MLQICVIMKNIIRRYQNPTWIKQKQNLSTYFHYACSCLHCQKKLKEHFLNLRIQIQHPKQSIKLNMKTQCKHVAQLKEILYKRKLHNSRFKEYVSVSYYRHDESSTRYIEMFKRYRATRSRDTRTAQETCPVPISQFQSITILG